jgi:hypothetical protein
MSATLNRAQLSLSDSPDDWTAKFYIWQVRLDLVYSYLLSTMSIRLDFLFRICCADSTEGSLHYCILYKV